MQIYPQRFTRAEIWGTDLDRYILSHPAAFVDDVLIDLEIWTGTHSRCDMCGHSCCAGTTISKQTAELLEPHLNEIREFLPDDAKELAKWTYSNEWKNFITQLREIEPGKKFCSFLYKKDNWYLCSIYSWAVASNRTVFDYWPFECIMYPVALLPYNGLLHAGKEWLTLRHPQNWKLIDVYGNVPYHNSLIRKLQKELKQKWRKKIIHKNRSHQRPHKMRPEPHFCENKSKPKPLSYVYYRHVIEWYFGEEFYQKFANLCDLYIQEHLPEIKSAFISDNAESMK